METVRGGSFFRKMLLGLVVLVAALMVIGWLVLYAPYAANDEKILLARNRYFYQLSRILPPEKLLYALRPIAVVSRDNEAEYIYKLEGRVKRVDYEDGVLTISDMWGKEWRIRYLVTPIAASKGMFKLDINEMTIRADGQVSNQMKYIVIDPAAPDDTQGFNGGEMVIVTWRDKRQVGEIEGIIELQSDKIVPITRVVFEGTQ